MKILRIESGKGFFSIDGSTWEPVDEVDKSDLMILLNIVLKADAEMDAFSAEAIGNQAHQIIYKSIYEKLNTLIGNKNKFKDESDRLYLEAIEKYSR
jgi:hypothetical protein